MRKEIRDDIENMLKANAVLSTTIKDWGIEDKAAKYPALMVFPPARKNKLMQAFPNIYRCTYSGVIRVIIEAYNNRLDGISTADEIDSQIEEEFKNDPTLGGKYYSISYDGSQIIYGEYGTDYWGEGLVVLDINYTVQAFVV